MSMRYGADHAITSGSAPEAPYHVGRGPGLVQEHQLGGIELGLLLRPVGAVLGHVGAILFGGVQQFF